MLLSRVKPASVDRNGSYATKPEASNGNSNSGVTMPTLDDFLKNRDFIGAMTYLDFERESSGVTAAVGGGDEQQWGSDDDRMRYYLWYGYCAFHAGNYEKALQIYEDLLRSDSASNDSMVQLYGAVVKFYLAMYQESFEIASKVPSHNRLAIRLLFHLAQKIGDEAQLMSFHQKLQDVVEDQMTLASIHYMRTHYQEAIDVYKRLLMENRELIAINVFVALCYYRLEYYDVSQEVLAPYLQLYPTSFIALNLKACVQYKLYNGHAAEEELKPLTELMHAASGSSKGGLVNFFGEEVIKHNLVVFRGGEGALQTLPALVDIVPEARVNLVIYHLKHEDVMAAYDLLKDVEPSNPIEYILKGIVNAALGQEQESKEHLKIAHQYFQLVGSSASECDTIPGRQCMASCYFLMKQFEDVLVYLSSIKTYFHNDDNFNFNYAQAKIGVKEYKEGEEALLLIQNERIKSEYAYTSHLAKCYIMNKKANKAWEMYLTMETSSESYQLLLLIANESFKTKQYLVAMKAFDALERLDPNSAENYEGKKASVLGLLQGYMNGGDLTDVGFTLKEALQQLRGSRHPQMQLVCQIIRGFSNENGISLF